MAKIRKSNVLFDNDDHHDSHEFLSWLINEIHENVEADNKDTKSKAATFVTDLFGGTLISRTTCLCCEQNYQREETFIDLSVDIDRNNSLSHCLKRFSHKELMSKSDKFYCENCHTKQVATRQMIIKKKPKALIVHLKRFKIDIYTLRHQKLSDRIPYPTEMMLEDS